jgi:glutaredoxin-related protein
MYLLAKSILLLPYYYTMKSFVLLLLATSASAFQTTSNVATVRSAPLQMAAEEATADAVITPNAAIKVAANGMSFLKPIFAAEASIQAAVLGALAKIDVDAVKSTIEAEKKVNPVLIYTYSLSPFSTEALSILEKSGYRYKNIELGAEWFLLGAEGSQTRVELAKAGAGDFGTSLPKIFIGGECIGGCSELMNLVEEGKLDETMVKAKVSKKGAAPKKPSFLSMFS